MSDKQRKRGSRRRDRSAILNIAATISPGRNALVLFCLIVAGVAEGIGVASLLPLIAVIGDGSDSAPSGLSRTVLDIIDRVGLPHDPRMLLGVLVIGMVLKAGLVLAAMRQVGYAVAEVGTKMRLNLINALLDARWGFYVRQPVGRFANALSIEASRAGEAYNSVAQFLANAIQAVVYLGVAALVSWELALLSLAVGLFMVMSLNRLLIMARRSAKKQTRRMKTMISRLADVLVGIKPMKAMGRQARFGALFLRDVEEINTAMRRQVFSKHANKALQEPILAICLAVGIYAALTIWRLPVAELVVMSLLLAKTVSTIGKAQQDLQAVQISSSGYWSIRDAADDARAARETTPGAAVPTFERALEFRDVSFAFGSKPIISHASFEVPVGKVTAITGPSGAGKTTLVDIMLGLHEPTAGAVMIDGVPLSQLDVMRWRNMTGYVPQELILFHDTIMANVTLDQPEFTRADVEQALRQAGAWDFISQMPAGIDTVVGERGTLLSGGQRQRIAVARALVHRPKLLILDEATSALDPMTEATIVRNVCELAQRTGLTVLSISHQPAWVAAADRVVQLHDRVVVELPPKRVAASAG